MIAPDATFTGRPGRHHLAFTPAEEVVACLLKRGLANKEIALELDKAESTIKRQVSSILRKLDTCNRGRAIAELHRNPSSLPARPAEPHGYR